MPWFRKTATFEKPPKGETDTMSVKEGPVVRIHHYRMVETEDGPALVSQKTVKEMNLTPLAKGGMTEVQLIDPDTEEVIAAAQAECSPLDTFNKRMGRIIAYGRATLPAAERRRREDNRIALEEERNYKLIH